MYAPTLGTREWGCRIPAAMADDGPMWRAYWRQSVGMGGAEPAGEPSLRRHDQGVLNGEPIFPDDPAEMFVAVGPVVWV